MDVCVELDGLFYRRYLLQHLLAALGALYRFFPVKRAQFLNDRFLAADLLLLVQILFELCVAQHLLLF